MIKLGMRHNVSVDLSAKVEQWSKNSAVAFSNGIQGSALVSKKVKKLARDWVKIQYPDHSPAFYTFQLFAAFIYLLIKPHLPQIGHLQVDQDYPGVESKSLIKVFILNFVQRHNPSLRGDFITLREVRGSKADRLARSIFIGQKTADRRVTLREIQAVFIK